MALPYDALVIGSGTAGQTTAYQLKKANLTVGLVEHSQRPGGTCALRGCQAKKWFFEGAATVARSRHMSDIGVASPAFGSWSQLLNAKNSFTKQVPGNTVNGLKQAGIEFIPGRARFVDKNCIEVDGRRLEARFFVLATGAVPMKLPIEGAERMIDSSEFLELETLPRRILFIGGGFISFEFAHFAIRLGSTETRCTILEAGRYPLNAFDHEMVNLLIAFSEKVGVEIHRNTTPIAIEKTNRSFAVHTEDGKSIETDLVVHGAGRVADIDDLGLDKADVDYSSEGIEVSDTMQTSNANIFAAGDCAATIQLARVADAEAQSAANNIIQAVQEKDDHISMDYSVVPAVLFTYPQLGMIGDTEDTLKDGDTAYHKSFASELEWPTYKRIGLDAAAYKLLVDEKDGRILGAHILSDNTSGLIYAIGLAMHNNLTIDRLYNQSVMTPYPSRESDIIYMIKPLL